MNAGNAHHENDLTSEEIRRAEAALRRARRQLAAAKRKECERQEEMIRLRQAVIAEMFLKAYLHASSDARATLTSAWRLACSLRAGIHHTDEEIAAVAATPFKIPRENRAADQGTGPADVHRN